MIPGRQRVYDDVLLYSIVSGQLFSERLQRKTIKIFLLFHPAHSKKIFPDTNFVKSYELMHTPGRKKFLHQGTQF